MGRPLVPLPRPTELDGANDMKKRWMVPLVALAVLMAACGESDDTDASADTDGSATETAPETADDTGADGDDTDAGAEADDPDADGADEAAADDTAEDAGPDGGCEAGFRLFENDLLETDPVCIPEDPSRIAALAPAPFEVMLAIGEEAPTGAIGYLESIYQRNFPYTDEQAGDVEFVGFPANLEVLVGLQPDLIVQSPFGQEEVELLREIAPTVVLPTLPNVEWETNMRFTGELLNRTAEVDGLIEQYEQRVADLQELLGDPSQIEISVVRYFDDEGAGGLQMQLANAFSTDILADVGLARPESQAYTAEEATEIYDNAVAATLSLEEVALLDAEYLFAWSQAADTDGDEANEAAWTSLRDDPLFATLEAVQNDQTFQVGGHWVGWGFHAAHEVLDDLFVHVAGVDPAEVSPNPFVDR